MKYDALRLIPRILVALILLAGVGYLVYAKRFRPIPVSGYEIIVDDLVVEVMGTGTVEARTSTIVSPKIPGRLIELGVDQDDRVEAGEIIARLDDGDLARQVEIAQANVEAADAGLTRLGAEESRAQAVLRQAKREDARILAAFEKMAVSESERDDSEERVAIAEADLAASRAAVAEGRKVLISAEKSLEYQQARLSDTIIRAPFAGLVVRRDRDPGDIVVPGSSIYRVVATDEIWISAWVDETAMAALAPDQPAHVVLRSEPDHPYPGHVVRLGRETDPETREFIVDVAIEELPERWAIGQRAEALIETQRLEQVLSVPLAFVSFLEGRKGVFVYRDGRAAWTACGFGVRGREMVEVREGLLAGDVVVRLTRPTARGQLRDGRRIGLE